MTTTISPPEPQLDIDDELPEATDEPIDDLIDEPADATAGESALPATAAQRRRRRRRVALLILLAAAASVLLVFSGWYLFFRRPISDLLPDIVAPDMPGYAYSLYGVRRPMGIAVSPDGARVYVTQTEGDTAVIVFDGHGTELDRLAPPATNSDHAFVYVAVDPSSGEVYVTDRPAGAVHVYGADGEYLRTIAAPPGLGGWQPLGVSITPDGALLVTDVARGQVHELTTDGSLLRTVGTLHQFAFPNAAAIDATGTIYVSDSNNGRLVILDSDGNQLTVLRRGANAGDLGMPRGVAIDGQARLYVVDTTDQSVKVYRAAGGSGLPPEFLGRFGGFGIGDGAFRFPNAVAIDARGRVYVADWSNDRVQVWTY